MSETVRPMISTQILTPVVEKLREAGHRASPILIDLGMNPNILDDVNEMVGLHQYIAFFEAAAKVTGNPHFGLEAGKSFSNESLGALGFLFASAPTLSDAIDGLTQYLSALQEGTYIELKREDGVAKLEYLLKDDTIAPRRQDAEYSIAASLNLIKNYVGPDFKPLEICFEHERIGNHSYYEMQLGCHVFFGQSLNYIMFDPYILDKSAPTISRKLYPIILNHLQGVLSTKETTLSISDQINAFISNDMLERGVTLNAMAKTLGVSVSTLSRRLKSEGTSFNEILKNRRISAAKRLLAHTHNTINQIALRVGYSENASFTRAFKKESGMTPEEYRRTTKESFSNP